jgi:hypothetical protein
MAPRSAMKQALADHGWNPPVPDVDYTFPLRARATQPAILVRQFLGNRGVVEAQAMLSSAPGDLRAFNLDSLSSIEMSYRILGVGVQGGLRSRYAALTLGPQVYREAWRIRESHFWQDPDIPRRQLWNGYVSDTSRTEYFVALGIRGSVYHRLVHRVFVEAWGQYMAGPSRTFPGTAKFRMTTNASRNARTMGLGVGYAF